MIVWFRGRRTSNIHSYLFKSQLLSFLVLVLRRIIWYNEINKYSQLPQNAEKATESNWLFKWKVWSVLVLLLRISYNNIKYLYSITKKRHSEYHTYLQKTGPKLAEKVFRIISTHQSRVPNTLVLDLNIIYNITNVCI